MSEQSHIPSDQQEKLNRQKDISPAQPEQAEGQAADAILSGSLSGAAGDNSVRSKAARLSDHRFQTVQRQANVAQVGQVKGNRYLQRVMAKGKEKGPQATDIRQANDPGEHEIDELNAETSTEPEMHSSNQELAVQRYTAAVSVHGLGSSSDPSTVNISSTYGTIEADPPAGLPTPSWFDFNGASEDTTLAEGTTSGKIHFHTFERTTVNNVLLNDYQWGSWDGTVPFIVNGDQISFGGTIINSDVGGSGATMSVSVGSGQNPTGGYVSFALTVSASGSTTLGGGIGVGPISASAPVSGTANFAGGMTQSFTLNIRTTPARPINGPDVSFKVGSAALEDGQEEVIARWFEGLPGATRDAIINGRRIVTISGYASTTGRRRHNRDLSEQRAHVVERILRGHVGALATLNPFFLGEDNSATPDEKEDPTWRRTTIVVQAPSHSAPGIPGPAAPGAR
jgi:outer membrane protein OmpA-like peptidoglycan-associated protein